MRRPAAWASTSDARRRIAAALSDALAGAPVSRPHVVTGGDHVHHQFVVRSSERDALRRHLGLAGISTGVHYPVPIHRSPAYRAAGLGPGSPVRDTALVAGGAGLPGAASSTARGCAWSVRSRGDNG